MGQFLGVGIVTKMMISKDKLVQHGITKEELMNEIAIQYHYDLQLFREEETPEYYLFYLKESVLHKELIPFLESFYPLVYPFSRTYYDEVLEKLKKTEPAHWLELAKQKEYEAFQSDEYGEPDYLYFNKPFDPYASLSFTTILLSMEGKIVMESFGRQFSFFKLCMHKTFPEFSLAKALRVYITG